MVKAAPAIQPVRSGEVLIPAKRASSPSRQKTGPHSPPKKTALSLPPQKTGSPTRKKNGVVPAKITGFPSPQ